MKTFIISYMISLVIVIVPFLPDVVARPLHILPRLAFYMAFPLAIFLSAGFILLGTYFGFYKQHEISKGHGVHKDSESDENDLRRAA